MTSDTPRWAKVFKSSHEPGSNTTKSEFLMRVDSCRHWHAKLHEAERSAWKYSSQSLLKEWNSWKRIPCEVGESNSSDDDHRPSKRQRNEESSDAYTIFPSADGALFPMEELPCLLVTPPSCRLDNAALCQTIWDELPSREAKVLLSSFSQTLLSTCRNILRQVLEQESSRAIQYTIRLRLRQKKVSSIQDALIWWASQTRDFDSLTIIIENPGDFEERIVRQDFYTAVTEWRRLHGVPVNLIVVGPSTDVKQMRVSHSSISASSWMQAFFKSLDKPIPLSFQSWKTHLDRFKMEHMSCSLLVKHLEEQLSHCHLVRGSFGWNTHHNDFVCWFLVYANAKKLLNGAHGENKVHMLDQASKLRYKLNLLWNMLQQLLPFLYGFATWPNEKESSAIVATSVPALAEMRRFATIALNKELLVDADMTRLRQTLQSFIIPKDPRTSVSLASEACDEDIDGIFNQINELVVLCSDGQVGSHLDSMKMTLHGLLGTVGVKFDDTFAEWKKMHPLFQTTKDKDLPDPEFPNIRREIVDGLQSPAREIYGLMEGCFEAVREDLFYHFGGSSEEFMAGIWCLILLGLVEATSKRNGQLVYSKTSVVWCES